MSRQAPDTLTYEPYFGLGEKPFSLNADSRFEFDSPTYRATRDSLFAGIRRREGLNVLTGEIGTGKTMLCRAVIRDLGRKTYSSIVPDPFASREDLLKMLLIDFGVLSIQELTEGRLRQASRTELGYLLPGNLNLAIGAKNLLDKYPDRLNADNSFGIFLYPQPSPYGYNGRFVYTRLEMTIGH